MGRPKILIDNSYQQLLHSDIKKITDSDIVIKLKAISASLSNKESDVAIMYGISRSTLLRWISKYQKYGVEGLRSKKRGHYPEKLSKEEKAIIFKWISTSKDNSGKQVHWTLVRLIKEIFTVFGKEIGKTPLWLTLKKLNLTIKVPRPKHHKSNEEDQLNFKKNSNND